VFSLLLLGIGLSLALYGKWFFGSNELISGGTREYVMSKTQPVCVQRQMSLKQGANPSDDQISKYCTCVSIQTPTTRRTNASRVQMVLAAGIDAWSIAADATLPLCLCDPQPGQDRKICFIATPERRACQADDARCPCGSRCRSFRRGTGSASGQRMLVVTAW
jgi:hypothetical protein